MAISSSPFSGSGSSGVSSSPRPSFGIKSPFQDDPSSSAPPPAETSPGVFGSFVKGFFSRAAEDLGGGQIAGLGDVTGVKWLQHLGESIENAPSDRLKEDVAKVEAMPWFDDQSEWYDVHPSRIPTQLAKVATMMGTGIPFLLQTMGSTWIGRKAVGLAMGAAGGAEAGPGAIATGIAGAVASDVMIPASVMTLGSIHSFYKEQRALGIDDDIIRENAVKYGMINGLSMTLRSQAALGAAAAGASKSVVSPSIDKGMRYVIAKMLKSAGVAVPAEIEMAGFNVMNMKLMDTFTKKNTELMQQRYANWQPSQDRPELTMGDYLKGAAEGALFGGTMRAAGFAKGLIMGQSKAQQSGAWDSAIAQLTGHNGAKVLSRSEAEAHVQAISDAFDSRAVQRKLDKSGDASKNLIREIAMAGRTDMNKAIDIFDRHAGTVTIKDGSSSEEIVGIVKRLEADGSVKKGYDEQSGRSFLIANQSILPTQQDAARLFHTVRLEANYEDVAPDSEGFSKWNPEMKRDDVNNDPVFASFMGIPHRVDSEGKVQFTPENLTKLRDSQKIANAYLNSPEGSLHAGAPLRISYVNRMMMTEAQLRKVDYWKMVSKETKWYKDGKLVYTGDAPSDPTWRAAIEPKASNYFNDGRVAVSLNHGAVAHEHFVEELLESPLKRLRDDVAHDSPLAKAHDTLQRLVSAWVGKSRSKMSEEVTRLKSQSVDVSKLPGGEERKSSLLGMIGQIEKHAQTGKLPKGRLSETVLKEMKAKRSDIMDGDMGNVDGAKALQDYLFKYQMDLGLVSDADIASRLYHRLTEADGMNAATTELFSNSWKLTQWGLGELMPEREKNLLKYMTFDPETAAGIKEQLRLIHGDRLYEAMENGRHPMKVEEFYKSPEDRAKETEKAHTDEMKAIRDELAANTAALKDLRAKAEKGEPIKAEDIPLPKPPTPKAEDAGADHPPSGPVTPQGEAVSAEGGGVRASIDPQKASGTPQTTLGGDKTQKPGEGKGLPAEGRVEAPSTPIDVLGEEPSKTAPYEQFLSLAKGLVPSEKDTRISLSAQLAGETTELIAPRAEADKYDVGYNAGLTADQKVFQESKKYRGVVSIMGTFMGGYKRAETIFNRMVRENHDAFLKMTDQSISDDVFKASLKETADDTPEMAVFKKSAQAMMEVHGHDRAFFRSMVKFYGSLTPIRLGFFKQKGSFFTKDSIINTNKFDRFSEFKHTLESRIRTISAAPEMQKAIGNMVKALKAKSKESLAEHPVELARVMEAITGIKSTTWLGDPRMMEFESKGHWIGKSFDAEGNFKGKSWAGFAQAVLLKEGQGFDSNLRRLVNLSNDKAGYDLHGKNHEGDNTLGALPESPMTVALRDLAATRGQDLQDNVMVVSGLQRPKGNAADWDKMTDSERLMSEMAMYRTESTEQGQKYGFFRIPPMGDKTAGVFVKMQKFGTAEALAKYRDYYQNAKKTGYAYLHELITPEALEARVKSATHIKGVKADMLGEMIANQALVQEKLYKVVYGSRSAYKAEIEDMIKRGSQNPSGGAQYKGKPMKVMFLKGAPGKRLDGQIVHTDAFTPDYEADMGSQYPSTVIKGYIRYGDVGVKSESIALSALAARQDPLYSGLAELAKKYPDVTHFVDEDSVKFGKESLNRADVFKTEADGSISVDTSKDLSGFITEVPAESLFTVQSLERDGDSREDLQSRQIIRKMDQLPGAERIWAINNKIVDLLLSKNKTVKIDLANERFTDLRRYVEELGENPENVLHYDQLFQRVANKLRDVFEPKVNRAITSLVSIGGKDIPGWGKSDGGNHLPWVVTNARNEGRALRKAISFGSRESAMAELKAGIAAGRYSDLLRCDDNGIPVRDINALAPDAIREWNGRFYIPGSLKWEIRTPTDSVLSGAPHRAMDSFSETKDGVGISATSVEGTINRGDDFDGDVLNGGMYFLDKSGNEIWDDSVKGLMNRRLNLMTRAYLETPLEYLTSDKAHGGEANNVDALEGSLKEIARGVKMPVHPRNTREFNESMIQQYTAAKDMLGIAAKNGVMFDLEAMHGGHYLVDVDLGNGQKVSLSKAEADKLAKPESLKDRHFLNNVLGRGLINFFVNDAKDPLASRLMNRENVSMAISAIRGLHITPENYKAELGKFFKWFTNSPEMKAYNKAMQEMRMTGGSFQKVFSDLSKTLTPEEYMRVRSLWEIGQARRKVASVNDAVVASKAPQSLFDYRYLNENAEKALAGEIPVHVEGDRNDPFTHGSVYNSGSLGESPVSHPAYVYLQKLGEYAKKGIMGTGSWDKLVEMAKGKRAKISQDRQEKLYEATRKAIVYNAVHAEGVDVQGLPKRFDALRESYPVDSPARKFLGLLDASSGSLRILEDYRFQELAPEVQKAARDGFDALKPEDQAALAEYTFQKYGLSTSNQGGGWHSLIGDAYHKGMNDRIMAEQERWKTGKVTDAELADVNAFAGQKATAGMEQDEMTGERTTWDRWYSPKAPRPVQEPLQGTTEGKPISTPTPESPKAPTASQRIVGPVVKFQGESYVGEIGQSHDQIAQMNALPKPLEADRMFRLSDGRDVGRMEGMNIARKADQVHPDFEDENILHSHMLQEAPATFAARPGEAETLTREQGDAIDRRMNEIRDVASKALTGGIHNAYRDDILKNIVSTNPENRRAAMKTLVEKTPSEVSAPVVDKMLEHDGARTLIMETPLRSYAARLADEGVETVLSNDTGKYGVHRTFFEFSDMVKAKVNTANMNAEKWFKAMPEKHDKAWEAIYREIDSPGHLDNWLKTNKDPIPEADMKAIVKEFKPAYDAVIAEANEMMKHLSEGAAIEYRENYINRMWGKKTPAEMGTFQRTMDSKHAAERRFETIAEGEKQGFRLIETNPVQAYLNYVKDVYSHSGRKTATYRMFMIRNGSGELQVIPIFHGSDNRPPERYVESALNEAGNSLSLANGGDGWVAQKWDGMKKSFDYLTGKKPPHEQGYVRMESPFAEYAGFWVHPDSINPAKMMFDRGFDSRFMTTVSRINNWSKFMTLGLSLFHPFALWEATVAALHGDAFKMQGMIPRYTWNVDASFKAKLKDAEFIEGWIKDGMSVVTANPNFDEGMIGRDLSAMKAWGEDNGNKAVAAMASGMMKYKGWVDRKLWMNFHSHAKLYTAETLLMKMTEQAAREGRTLDIKDTREQIAKTVNQGYGGLNMDRMMFATPKVRQMLHTFMFAPDWTITNAISAAAGAIGAMENIPGAKHLPGMEFLGDKLTPIQKKWALTVHWPAMLTFMLAWPNVIQAAIYAAFGDDKKGDKAFASENEKGKEFTVDVTPMFRKLGIYENKDNPMERSYMRFAKQAWEVADMVENPIKSLKGKSSAAFRIAYEQVTGDNTLGRKFAFADESLVGGLFGSDKGWVESRTGTIMSKFVPMSILTYLGGQPPTFLAPVSKGMTRAKAELELAKSLNAYADPSVWAQITGRPGYEQKLDALVPDILEAAQRNGVNIEEALKTARSHVLAKYYDRFWRAFNRDNAADLETYSQSVVRLHGTLRGLEGSIRAKEGRYNKKPSPEDVRRAREAFMRGEQDVVPAGVNPNLPWTNLKKSRKTIQDYLAQE